MWDGSVIDDAKHFTDPQQLGCLNETSTSYFLLDMLHNWLSTIDQPGKFLRVCFLHFSAAFDHIDHTILIYKLVSHLGERGFDGSAAFLVVVARLFNLTMSSPSGCLFM